ncbi:DNA starvation/stationary phase protection protein [Nocardia zapadnayensis]|uniref:DNA starvation/stationary phase protection protein n=1 Tax=Brevibacterium pityocampae TaxID=506594 RepID=A0ABP8JGF0_9MICO|nr:DNA starvation/stationary phase protection protein [Nocardia zapadnayensis]MCX0276319.1 DNA starvation/stationary phase protection protein [Nocardia zapadnayensis]
MAYTLPGLSEAEGEKVAGILQERLDAMNALHLILKHAHWNVVGPAFIGVHEMLDPQVELVRGFADEIAERIAALGSSPNGVPSRVAWDRPGMKYELDRASTQAHIAALDAVYDDVNAAHREAVAATAEIDPMSEDLLTAQTRELEQFQWFLRAHLDDGAGNLKG